MKCPTCGYNSFDYLESCKKCGSTLGGDPRMKTQSRPGPDNGFGESETRSGGAGDNTLAGELSRIPINEHLTSPASEEPGRPSAGRHGRIPDRQVDLPYQSRHGLNISEEDGERYNEEREPGRFSEVRGEGEHAPGADRGRSHIGRDPFGFDESQQGPLRGGRETDNAGYEQDAQVFNLAGVFSRATAFLIDILIISAITVLSVWSGLYFAGGANAGSRGSEVNALLLYAALFILASTYFIFLHAFGGKTVGKMVMGIKLINNEGDTVGIREAFIRWVGYYLSAAFLFAGFIWSLFDSESQAWHDKIAGTFVVKE